MNQSHHAEHFFQTDASVQSTRRRAAKASNRAGDPIRLPSKILAVAADPHDARGVYVAESAGVVRRVQLDDPQSRTLYSGPTAPLSSLALSTDTLFAGCWDKAVWSWDVRSRAVRRRFRGHTDFVKAVLYFRHAAQPGGREREVLVSGGADALILVWDVGSGEKLHALRGHARGVLGLVWDPFGGVGGEDEEEGGDGAREDTAHDVDDDDNDNDDDRSLRLVFFSAGSDREIRRWTITLPSASSSSTSNSSQPLIAPPPPPSTLILAHETSVNALCFDSDGELWTASADRTARCLYRERKWAVDTVLEHPDFVTDVVSVPGGGGGDKYVVTACRDEEVRVWEMGTGSLLHTFTGHFDEVTGLTLVGEGCSTLVSVSIDGTIRRWDVGERTLRASSGPAAATVAAADAIDATDAADDAATEGKGGRDEESDVPRRDDGAETAGVKGSSQDMDMDMMKDKDEVVVAVTEDEERELEALMMEDD